jgi:hypothetical protein
MGKFTLELRVFYVNYKSARKSKGKFRRKFPGVKVPHRNTTQNLVNEVKNKCHIDKQETKSSVLNIGPPVEQKLGHSGFRFEHSPHESLLNALTRNGSNKMKSENRYKITNCCLTKQQ